MGDRYLLLGGSAEVCGAFLQQHTWSPEDEILAQYCHSCQTLTEIKSAIPAKMTLCPVDFLSLEGTEKFAEQLSERAFIPTHILHAPAIPIQNQRFTEISWKEAEQQIDVQCRSLYILLQAVLPKMAKTKKGSIVVVLSSFSLNVPPPFLTAYVMAKYALMGLTKALATEYAPKGIRCNMISPSMMETKFLSNLYEGIAPQAAAKNPMRRNASPEDAAGVIEYLFSERSTFVTGVNIPIAGGEVF